MKNLLLIIALLTPLQSMAWHKWKVRDLHVKVNPISHPFNINTTISTETLEWSTDSMKFGSVKLDSICKDTTFEYIDNERKLYPWKKFNEVYREWVSVGSNPVGPRKCKVIPITLGRAFSTIEMALDTILKIQNLKYYPRDSYNGKEYLTIFNGDNDAISFANYINIAIDKPNIKKYFDTLGVKTMDSLIYWGFCWRGWYYNEATNYFSLGRYESIKNCKEAKAGTLIPSNWRPVNIIKKERVFNSLINNKTILGRKDENKITSSRNTRININSRILY